MKIQIKLGWNCIDKTQMQQKKITLLVQWNAKIFWILSKMYGNVMNGQRKKHEKKRNRICLTSEDE